MRTIKEQKRWPLSPTSKPTKAKALPSREPTEAREPREPGSCEGCRRSSIGKARISDLHGNPRRNRGQTRRSTGRSASLRESSGGGDWYPRCNETDSPRRAVYRLRVRTGRSNLREDHD